MNERNEEYCRTYNGSLLRRLNLRLKVRRRMKVAAGLAVAPALDEIHTHGDVVVGIDGHAIRRMSVATLRLRAGANTSLILTTNLDSDTRTELTTIAIQHYIRDPATVQKLKDAVTEKKGKGRACHTPLERRHGAHLPS